MLSQMLNNYHCFKPAYSDFISIKKYKKIIKYLFSYELIILESKRRSPIYTNRIEQLSNIV